MLVKLFFVTVIRLNHWWSCKVFRGSCLEHWFLEKVVLQLFWIWLFHYAISWWQKTIIKIEMLTQSLIINLHPFNLRCMYHYWSCEFLKRIWSEIPDDVSGNIIIVCCWGTIVNLVTAILFVQNDLEMIIAFWGIFAQF